MTESESARQVSYEHAETATCDLLAVAPGVVGDRKKSSNDRVGRDSWFMVKLGCSRKRQM